MRRLPRSLLVVVLAATAARADFEGVADATLSVRAAKGRTTTGTTRTFLTRTALRHEVDLRSPEVATATGRPSVKMAWIQRLAEPGVLYSVDDERQSYSITKLSRDPGTAAGRYTVKRLGMDTVAGWACEKVLVTSKTGQETDLCIAKDIVASPEWLATMGEQSPRGEGWLTALREAGAEGYPVRMVVRDPGDAAPRVAMELVRAERKPVPPSLFEIPATFRKADFSGAEMLAPEQAQQMRDALRDMSPEERKAVEDMMRQHGLGER